MRIHFGIAFLAFLFASSPLPAAADDALTCKKNVIFEKLGPRPPPSGLILSWVEMTFRTANGASLPIEEIYLGGSQPFPRVGSVCSICYRIGAFPGVVMPKSNILETISCPGQRLDSPLQE